MDIPIKQTNDANARASKVRLVVFDVDGVLTSGQTDGFAGIDG